MNALLKSLDNIYCKIQFVRHKILVKLGKFLVKIVLDLKPNNARREI